jgi:hypothetical protein
VIEFERTTNQIPSPDGILCLTNTQSLPIGYDSITQSKEINLSGILLRSLSGQPVVFLSDLVRIGYQILPEKLMQSPSLQSALKKQDRVSSLKNEIINDLSKNSLDYE